MSGLLDKVIDARDDTDEAQMRSFFYGAGGFDSDEEEAVINDPPCHDIQALDSAEGYSVTSTELRVIPELDLSIRIEECKQRGIAHQVWPAATYLSEFLVASPHLLSEDVPHEVIEPCSIECVEEIVFLELGAGLGVTGIYLHKYFREVPNPKCSHISVLHTVITDLPEALEGLQKNINLNEIESKSESLPSLSASVLSWGNENELLQALESLCQQLSPIPNRVQKTETASEVELIGEKENLQALIPRRTLVVLAADVIYWECLFDPLLDCLQQLFDHTTHPQGRFSSYFSQTRVFIAHYKRWKKDQIFINRCQKRLQKQGLASFQCLHEEIVPETPESGKSSTKKELRRIYLIKSK